MSVRLEVRDLRFTYSGAHRPCLLDIAIEVAPSEMLYVLGPSGSGKSTLLRVLAGDLVPDAGEVRLDGRPRSRGVGGAFPYVGYQGQFPEHQFFARSVWEEVGFGLARLREQSGRSDGSCASDTGVAAALEMVGLPASAPDRERSPWSLSQGEQRRLALASVLVFEPAVLLLDEPTVGLDRAGRESLTSALDAVRARGAAVIAGGHDLAWAVSSGAELALLAQGELRRVNPGRKEDRAALVAGGYELPGSWGFFAGRLPGFWAEGLWRGSPEDLAAGWRVT